MRKQAPAWPCSPAILAVLAGAGLLLSGCTSARLNGARRDFHAGRLAEANAQLEELPSGSHNRILYLMERGMIRQAAGDYEASAKDWLEAGDLAEELDYFSVSKSTASMVANDNLLAYRGYPFERMLMHTFAAKNFLALGRWDSAAVEGRRLIERLENLDGFPDDPYSRYMAAFTLQMQGDRDGAAFQYKAVSERVSSPTIDPREGYIAGGAPPQDAELVCFVLIGRGPTGSGRLVGGGQWGTSPYAEIYDRGHYLGRSYELAATHKLRSLTDKKLAAKKTAKTVGRVVLKDTAARAVARENEALGALLWLIMFAAEQPDERRWETLPRWLQVARVPCPSDLKEFRIVFRSTTGAAIIERKVSAPLTRSGRTFFSFCRDNP